MSCTELQEEEIEVLRSIYDGDEKFKEVSPTSVQYLIGDKGAAKSFLLEISWGQEYPNVVPTIIMDAFYNKHIGVSVKNQIKEKILEEANQLIGMSMTYTIIEFAKEHLETLTNEISEPEINLETLKTEIIETEKEDQPQSSVKLKQPKLTKRQKRKLADKTDSKGEMIRGWNWVDIVKHLSQTGSGSADS